MDGNRNSRQLPTTDVKDIGKRTLYKRLHLLSLGKGLCIAMILIVISVPLGNRQALNAKLEAARRVWDGIEVDGKTIPVDQRLYIGPLTKDFAATATNLITIMMRYADAATEERAALERARDAMRNANNPESVARAEASLFISFRNAMHALFEQTKVSDEDRILVDEVRISFNDQRHKLAIRARDYDRQMQKAIDTYNQLPTRALFSKPELFQSYSTATDKEGTT